jgi:putative glutamine amidotransferase
VTFSSRATPEQRRAYVGALEAQGARVVEVETGVGEPRIEGLDGLLLSGGGDIDPVLFGRARHPKTGNVDAARDEFELCLTREAMASGLPVLGICRGAQVLGVAFGGNLTQDIPDLVPNARQHSDNSHEVRVVVDSLLGRILGSERLEVNSFHHQANGIPGGELRAVAWSDDNVIEAIEAPEPGFVLGVQWHPERMADPIQARLFAAFAAAAAGRPRR